MNSVITIKDILTNIIGEYQVTTQSAVSVHVTGVDPTTPTSIFTSLSNGIGTLDIVWIASAILLITAFISIIGLIRAILVAVVR